MPIVSAPGVAVMSVGVTFRVGAMVLVALATGTGVHVGLTASACRVCNNSTISVPFNVGVKVGKGALVGRGVLVTVGVTVGSGVFVGNGVMVAVFVAEGVALKNGVTVGTGVCEGMGVLVAVGAGVCVAVLVGNGVTVSLGRGVVLAVAVAVLVGEGVGVSVGISGVAVAVNVLDGSRVNVADGAKVGLLVVVGNGSGVRDGSSATCVLAGVPVGATVGVTRGVTPPHDASTHAATTPTVTLNALRTTYSLKCLLSFFDYRHELLFMALYVQTAFALRCGVYLSVVIIFKDMLSNFKTCLESGIFRKNAKIKEKLKNLHKFFKKDC
jgi:hypothetical protein